MASQYDLVVVKFVLDNFVNVASGNRLIYNLLEDQLVPRLNLRN
jgi:hypothetical protein